MLLGMTFLLISLGLSTSGHVAADEAVVGNFFLLKETWVSVFKELGFACLIALLISIGIEETSREEFNATVDQRIRSVQENVFRSTFGRNIPDSLVRVVEDQVLRADFTRKDYSSVYSLKVTDLCTLDDGYGSFRVVLVDKELSYKVRNETNSPQDYEIRASIEIPPFEELKDLVEIQAVTVATKALTNEEIKAGDARAEDTKEAKCFSHTIEDIPAGDEVHVALRMRTIKMLDDVESWSAVIPSEDMTLTVHFPDEANHFGIMPRHHSALVDGLQQGRQKSLQKKIVGGVLPFQGITFWWRCSEDAPCSPDPKDVIAAADSDGIGQEKP